MVRQRMWLPGHWDHEASEDLSITSCTDGQVAITSSRELVFSPRPIRKEI